MQEIQISNPPVATDGCDPNKSRARQHRNLKLGSKLKYLKVNVYSRESFFFWKGIQQSGKIIEMMIQKNLKRLERMEVLITSHGFSWQYSNAKLTSTKNVYEK